MFGVFTQKLVDLKSNLDSDLTFRGQFKTEADAKLGIVSLARSFIAADTKQEVKDVDIKDLQYKSADDVKKDGIFGIYTGDRLALYRRSTMVDPGYLFNGSRIIIDPIHYYLIVQNNLIPHLPAPQNPSLMRNLRRNLNRKQQLADHEPRDFENTPDAITKANFTLPKKIAKDALMAAASAEFAKLQL